MVVISTTTQRRCLNESVQRKTFWANGRHWVFYSDGTNMVYRTSVTGDGGWSGATNIRACNRGDEFSIWFDGVYLHYVWADRDTDSKCKYRRGIPESDGSITWSAAEQDASPSPPSGSWRWLFPTICVDSAGRALIGYIQGLGTDDTSGIYCNKNDNTDGTWSDTSGFPYSITGSESDGLRITLVPLTNEKVYAVYGGWSDSTRGKLYDGSWGGTEFIQQDHADDSYKYISAVAVGDDIHLVHRHANSRIRYRKRTWASGWGGYTDVTEDNDCNCSISKDQDGNIYVFWFLNWELNVRKRNADGSWNGERVVSTVSMRADKECFSSFYERPSGSPGIGIAWADGAGSPYDVHYNNLLYDTSRSLGAGFRLRQDVEILPGKFDVGQDWENLSCGFSVRHGAAVNLNASMQVLHWARLKGSFAARHRGSAHVGSRFYFNQVNASRRLRAGFDIRNCYDFSSSLGISFYWWGSGHDIDVDLVLKTPTGNFVGAFGDGPPEWRWIFLSWDDFVETSIDGSRPNKAMICCILWTVHTSGTWRVDHLGMWRNFEVKGFFTVRHRNIRNLKAGFTPIRIDTSDAKAGMVIRRSTERTLLSGFIVRQPGSSDLSAGFATGMGCDDLKAGFDVGQQSRNLLGSIVVRHSGSRDLKGEMNIVHWESLKAGFTVVVKASESLSAGFRLRQDIEELSAEAYFGEDLLTYTEIDGDTT